MYVCSVEGGGALGGDDPRVNHNTYMWVCVHVCMCAVWREVVHSDRRWWPRVNYNTYMWVFVSVCMCAVWREVVHSEVMTPELTTIPTCECACMYVCVQCGGRWCTQIRGDDPRVNYNTYMWVCMCVCMCAVWREVVHSEVMTPESTTIPTCECACVYVCVQCGGRWCTQIGGDDPRVNYNTYMWVSMRVCMCAVWREVVHSEVMTPELTTIPTCEWACVYVCVQCRGRWCTRRWWPQS